MTSFVRFLRLDRDMKNANSERLGWLSERCIAVGWGFAFLLLCGLIGECVIAYDHAPYDSFEERWGSVIINIVVAVGVWGEVVTGIFAHLADAELTRRSNAQLAEANRKLSEALDRAAMAEKELALVKKGFGHRRLEIEPFIEALVGKPIAPVEIAYVLSDQLDSLPLAMDIWSGLNRAGWKTDTPVPVVKDHSGKYQHVHAAISVGGLPTGVTVVAHSGKEWTRSGSPFDALVVALQKGLPLFPPGAGEFPDLPEGTLRIVVAPRA
jgi:hypothetical protein